MLSFEDIVSREEGCSECGNGDVGAAPAENIQVVSCPDGSGQCQVATAATQGQIFNKLANMTATPAPAGEPNILFFTAVPKTQPGQLDALSMIKAGLATAPGSRVAVEVRNALGPSNFSYVMMMADPSGNAPPASKVVSPGSEFALVNAENAPAFDSGGAETAKKTSATTLIAGAVVGGGVGALVGGGVGAAAGAVGGAALANWLVG